MHKTNKIKVNSRKIRAMAKANKTMHNKIKVNVKGLAVTNKRITKQSREMLESAKDYQQLKKLF